LDCNACKVKLISMNRGHAHYNDIESIVVVKKALVQHDSTGCIKKKRNLGISQEITMQFLSIKDFRPLGIEIELLNTGCIKKTQPRNFLRNHFAILKHKRF
jgi:hypothetical protein